MDPYRFFDPYEHRYVDRHFQDWWLQAREVSNLTEETVYDILSEWGIPLSELDGLDPHVRCDVCSAREIGCTGLIMHRIGCPAPNWRIEKIEPRVIHYGI